MNLTGKMKGGRTVLVQTLLALVLIMTCRVVQYLPGMQFAEELWFALCFLALVFVYPYRKIVRGLRFSSFEIYVVALIVIFALLPSWSAKREFGQPLWYGLLAQRTAVLGAVPLFLVNALRSRRLRLRDIEAALLLCAWGTFFLFLAIRLFLKPENFASYGVGFVQRLNGKYVFALDTHFLVFGIVYYTLRGFRTRQIKPYILAAILFMGAFADTHGRGAIISLVVTLLYFLYRWRPLKQFLVASFRFSCVAAILIGLAYVVTPSSVSDRISSFSDAYKAVFTDEQVADFSANGRRLEIVTAIPYVQKHPLLGNGHISSQWEGGAQNVINEYFSEGDVGLLGVLFSVGLLGFLVFAYQFRFALHASRAIPAEGRDSLTDATMGFVLYLAIYSITTAMFLFDFEIPLAFIAILVGLAASQEAERSRSGRQLPLMQPLGAS